MPKSERPFVQCRACLYDSHHPFGLTFDDSGLCSGCTTHAEKTSLDWGARFARLERVVSPYRGRKGNYDCVMPVRGTAEYFYAVDVVKNRLGLNPLLVSFNSHFNSQAGIHNLDLLRETFDCDILQKTISPPLYKKLISETLSRLGSVHWPWLAGHTVWPVRVAVQNDIPLIIWSDHQPTEQAGMFSYQDENEMTRRSRHEHDLMQWEPQELTSGESLLSAQDVLTLQYPSDSQLAKTDVRGIYLANYLPWDTRRYSEEMVSKFGASAAQCPGTFDTYDHVDNLVYMSVHDAIKRRKLGYGRVRDHLCREIRFGRIGKTEAIALESAYAQVDTAHVNEMFFSWLGIHAQGFEWLLKHHFGDALPAPRPAHASTTFTSSYLRNAAPLEEAQEFILIGKGLVL